MKKNHFGRPGYLIALLATLLLTTTQCKKDAPEPRYKMNAKVDGTYWEAACDSGTLLWGCTPVACTSVPSSFKLSGGNKNNEIYVEVNYYDTIMIGKFDLNETKYCRVLDNKISANCVWLEIVDTTYNNWLEITALDTTKRRIEGRFAMRVKNECGDTRTVTDGYFNTEYYEW